MIEITRPGKYSLVLQNPVMIASGMMGFDPSPYRDLLKLEKLGAMVTNAVSWKARGPANGARVVSSAGGFLLHTGLPNPGIKRIVKTYSKAWERSPFPIIIHLIANSEHEVNRCLQELEGVSGAVAVELGIHDQATPQDLMALVSAARAQTQLPILVKLPLYYAPFLARPAQDGGADALVVGAPPRGTDRDVLTGRLIGGRMYGPWMKAQSLRAVGQIAHYVQIPVIGCGGIHTPDDARDFVEAGAKAVQIDTLLWIHPSMVEIIARNLGGLELTRAMGALADEWEPGIGKTELIQRQASPPPNVQLPEFFLGEDDMTGPTDPEL